MVVGGPLEPGPWTEILQYLRNFEERIAHLEANAEMGGDAHTVDGFHASAAALANTLIALAGDANLPDDTVDFGSLELAAQVWVKWWPTNVVGWNMANNNNWQTDTQTTTINPRRKSDLVVIGDILWVNSTAARIANMMMRWSLDGVGLWGDTYHIGNSFDLREHTTVLGVFPDVSAGVKTLALQAQKPTVAADTVWIYKRNVIILVLPKD